MCGIGWQCTQWYLQMLRRGQRFNISSWSNDIGTCRDVHIVQSVWFTRANWTGQRRITYNLYATVLTCSSNRPNARTWRAIGLIVLALADWPRMYATVNSLICGGDGSACQLHCTVDRFRAPARPASFWCHVVRPSRRTELHRGC